MNRSNQANPLINECPHPTGSAAYRASQVDAMAEDLKQNLYGNTHSENPSSVLTERRVEEVRAHVVRFFNTTLSEYSVVFTSGATAALHLLSETFPWGNASRFAYLEQSHNSVLGIREFCLQKGGEFCALAERDVEEGRCAACARKTAAEGAITPLQQHQQQDQHEGSGGGSRPYNLFAFPAEDNFSGVKYPLPWIERIQRSGGLCGKKGDWRVLLDAAAFVPTNPLDLGAFKPDFVAVSFYKVFGVPTGLGCLLVHKRSVDLLKKTYFGGGSVVVASPTKPITVYKMNPCERLEDGTLNFLSISALLPGFRSMAELRMDRIQRHVWSLTRWAYEQLSGLRHSNGAPVVRVYGKHDKGDKAVQGAWVAIDVSNNRTFACHHPFIYNPTNISLTIHSDQPRLRTTRTGGILSLNLLRPDGTFIGYHFVQQQSMAKGFHIRSGCSCNPGACFSYLGLREEEVATFFYNKDSCGDGLDVVNHGTLPLGAVRVSLGSLTTFEEVQAFIEFVKAYYVDTGAMSALGLHAAPRGPSSGAEEVGMVEVAPNYPDFHQEGRDHATVA